MVKHEVVFEDNSIFLKGFWIDVVIGEGYCEVYEDGDFVCKFDSVEKAIQYCLEKQMIDLMCIDCGAEFYEDELIDCKCPECGSSRYDYYDEVMEDGEDYNDRY